MTEDAPLAELRKLADVHTITDDPVRADARPGEATAPVPICARGRRRGRRPPRRHRRSAARASRTRLSKRLPPCTSSPTTVPSRRTTFAPIATRSPSSTPVPMDRPGAAVTRPPGGSRAPRGSRRRPPRSGDNVVVAQQRPPVAGPGRVRGLQRVGVDGQPLLAHPSSPAVAHLGQLGEPLCRALVGGQHRRAAPEPEPL